MNEELDKNWVTVSRADVGKALVWAKTHSEYITNDYSVIGGRTEHYQKGNDYNNFDFFFATSDTMAEFDKLFGVEK